MRGGILKRNSLLEKNLHLYCFFSLLISFPELKFERTSAVDSIVLTFVSNIRMVVEFKLDHEEGRVLQN